MGALLLCRASPEVVRAYLIDPSPCGCSWMLVLFENGEPAGGGSFVRGEDADGFDAGYQAALDQGEAWI